MSRRRKRRSDPGTPPVPHATATTVQARIEDFIRIILDGAQTWDLREFVRQQEEIPGSNWYLGDPDTGTEHGVKFAPLSRATIDKYRVWAQEQIIAAQEKRRPTLIATGLAKRHNMYAKAIAAGDVRTALAVQKDHDELCGLYPARDAKPDTSPPIHRPVTDDDDTTLEATAKAIADRALSAE
jgi:hypothetical protein